MREGLRNRLITGALLVALAASYVSRNSDRVKVCDLIYQGYHMGGADCDMVFDEDVARDRVGPPDLFIRGDPSGLEIGKKYDVDYIGFLGTKKVISVAPSD